MIRIRSATDKPCFFDGFEWTPTGIVVHEGYLQPGKREVYLRARCIIVERGEGSSWVVISEIPTPSETPRAPGPDPEAIAASRAQGRIYLPADSPMPAFLPCSTRPSEPARTSEAGVLEKQGDLLPADRAHRDKVRRGARSARAE